MRLLHVSILAVLLVSFATATDPAAPAIVFPKRPAVPQPMPPAPQPAPGGVFLLTADLLYVVDCKVDTVLRAHPAKLVASKKLKGPVTIYGKFADGGNQLEVRTYAGPVVYVLTAAGVGAVELDAIPVGFKDEKEIVTETVQVDNGQGPRPPPDPDPAPDPKPKPVDPAPIPGDGLRVLIVYESADLAKYPSAQNAILTALPIREYLNAKCPKGPDGKTTEFRIWDKDVDGYSDSPLWGDALKRPRASTPWIVISNGKTGFEGPLPATVADTLALLKKYGG